MISRFFSGLVTFCLVCCILFGMFLSCASLFAVELIGLEAKSQPNLGDILLQFVASMLDARARFVAENRDAIVAFATRGVWLGAISAFVLAVIYSGFRDRRTHRGPLAGNWAAPRANIASDPPPKRLPTALPS